MTEDQTDVTEPAGDIDEDLEGASGPGDRLVAASTSTHPVKVKSGVAFDTAQLPAVSAGVSPEPWEDDDFEDEGEDHRTGGERSRRARRLTAVLALVAAVGIGFASGVLFQKHQGGSSTSGASALASLFRGRTGTAGGGFGFGGAGSSAASGTVVGTVTAISGDTLYISSGTSSALTKVVTVPSSTITVPTAGTVSNISPGDSVVVRGAQQSDGSFVAGTITDSGTASAAAASPAG
jgi:hypothetical protein